MSHLMLKFLNVKGEGNKKNDIICSTTVSQISSNVIYFGGDIQVRVFIYLRNLLHTLESYIRMMGSRF